MSDYKICVVCGTIRKKEDFRIAIKKNYPSYKCDEHFKEQNENE